MTVDARRLIGDCLDAVALSVKTGVEVETNLQSVNAVRTDRDRLRRVLTDILDNAVRFTKGGC